MYNILSKLVQYISFLLFIVSVVTTAYFIAHAQYLYVTLTFIDTIIFFASYAFWKRYNETGIY